MPPTDAKLFRGGGPDFDDYWKACKKRNMELVLARRKALQGARNTRHIQEQGDIRTHFPSHKKYHIKPKPTPRCEEA
jgi:hypothetical protein